MVQEIFVFGSNLAGRHGKGAALSARRLHGATYGQGEGLQGNAYAIPTKSETLQVLGMGSITEAIQRFRAFAGAYGLDRSGSLRTRGRVFRAQSLTNALGSLLRRSMGR